MEYTNEETDNLEVSKVTVEESIIRGTAWLSKDAKSGKTESPDPITVKGDDDHEGADQKDSSGSEDGDHDDDDDESDDGEDQEDEPDDDEGDDVKGQVGTGSGTDSGLGPSQGEPPQTKEQLEWAEDASSDDNSPPKANAKIAAKKRVSIEMPHGAALTEARSRSKTRVVVPTSTSDSVAGGLFGSFSSEPLSATSESIIKNPLSYSVSDSQLESTKIARDTKEQWTIIKRQADQVAALLAWKEEMVQKHSSLTADVVSLRSVCDSLRTRIEEFDRSSLLVINQAQAIVQGSSQSKPDIEGDLQAVKARTEASIARSMREAPVTAAVSHRRRPKAPLF